jgi:hypothetical protein
MKSLSRLAVLLFCTLGAAHAATPMKELGMPLGQKMKLPIALCPSEGPAKDASAPCWAKPPQSLPGGIQSGSLVVPASAQASMWTAPGTYGAAIDRAGVLVAVTVYSARADEFAKIRGALTARLGSRLRSFNTDDQRRLARWEWKDAVIDLSCGADVGCATRFALSDREEKRLEQALLLSTR